MAGILGFLAALADDISSLAGKTMAQATTGISGSLSNTSILLDDIVTYTKIASTKSSGIVIDDLAAISNLTNETTTSILQKEIQKAHSFDELKQNITHLEGKEKKALEEELERLLESAGASAKRIAAQRELPIVWKIAKGSAKNKLIIIPLILFISAIAPWLMVPILVAGGTYLAYEGAESVIHKFFGHHDEQTQEETLQELSTEHFEASKVSSAIKTDFILSLEIMVIALSLVNDQPILTQIATLILVGFITTVGVYGIVAFIIKLDDIGFFLQARTNGVLNKLGDTLVAVVPFIIQFISIVGTVAMLAVGGGIIIHQLHLFGGVENWLEKSIHSFSWLGMFGLEVLFGLVVGYFAIQCMALFEIAKEKIKSTSEN